MAAASRKATRKPSPARSKSGPKAKPKTKAAPKARAARAKAGTKTGTKAKVKTKAKIQAKAKAKPKTAGKIKSAAKKTPAKKAAAKKATVNRRRFDRRDTRIAARLEHAGGVTEGTVTNLSLEGCLFAPRIDLKPNSRIKLYLASEKNSVAATVKAVSELGVHCLMHAGGVTLGRLSTDLDDMALLMLRAGRPHVVTPKAE
ncbi:MAG: PilZ domain-containing protein [Ferrovibrio sp.]|uniref:PilZ domain-containing protein n=1 Tax=Ferrovibrio sp. TaxID=1917215 RepID=UPI00391C78C2